MVIFSAGLACTVSWWRLPALALQLPGFSAEDATTTVHRTRDASLPE